MTLSSITISSICADRNGGEQVCNSPSPHTVGRDDRVQSIHRGCGRSGGRQCIGTAGDRVLAAESAARHEPKGFCRPHLEPIVLLVISFYQVRHHRVLVTISSDDSHVLLLPGLLFPPPFCSPARHKSALICDSTSLNFVSSRNPTQTR